MKTAHWGRVLGPVGLVLLVASLLTLFISGGTWLGQINVVLGLSFVAVYLVTNFRELNQFASSKGTFFVATSAVTSALVLGGLVAANYLAVKHPKSWDITTNKIYTLAPDTLQTLQGLKEPVAITAFIQNGEKGYDAWEDLFKRYQAINNEKFTYQFVDPVKDPMLVKQFNIREGGPRVVVKAAGLDQRVTNPTEEELTNALVKATHATEKKVYFLSGHGEADIDDTNKSGVSALVKRMDAEGLKAQKLTLAGSGEIPKDAEVVVIAGPSAPLAPGEVALLKTFIEEGGRLLVMLEPVDPSGGDRASGLEPMLQEWGIAQDPGLVVDVSAQKLFGTSPFFPVVFDFGAHEITKGFRQQTLFPTAASLTLTSSANANPVALFKTQAQSWVETTPQVQPIQHDPNEKRGPLVLGAAVTRDTSKKDSKRADEARLVVVGDKDFLTNGFITEGGNEDLALNSMNWLASQTERISIRPRTRDASRVYLSGAQMGGIRFFSTELPIAMLALGLAIYFNRRAR